MSRGGEGFEVEKSKLGLDVTYQGRAIAYDLDDMEEVQRVVKRWVSTGRAAPNATVTLVHADGYREVVRR